MSSHLKSNQLPITVCGLRETRTALSSINALQY